MLAVRSTLVACRDAIELACVAMQVVINQFMLLLLLLLLLRDNCLSDFQVATLLRLGRGWHTIAPPAYIYCTWSAECMGNNSKQIK
jgi:hypothetical protein